MTTIDSYRKMLGVNKHRLDDELEAHALVMERIGGECARLESRSRTLKDDLARVEGRVLFDMKDQEGPKATVAELAAMVARHRDRTAAFEKYEMARLEWQEWERLYDAWRSRDFAVRKLADLYGDQYFATDPVVQHERARKDREAGERRAAMRDASNRATGGDGESRRYREGELFEREQVSRAPEGGRSRL